MTSISIQTSGAEIWIETVFKGGYSTDNGDVAYGNDIIVKRHYVE